MPDYLVRIRHEMDDVPVMLTKELTTAIKFADKVSPKPTGPVAHATNSPDCSTPICADVVEFMRGRPSKVIHIRTFTEEEKELAYA